MRLILDGQLSATEASRQQIISLVEDYLYKASAEDKILISCRIDGSEVDDPVEVIRFNIPGDSLETVEIITRTREDLVHETAVTLGEYLDKLIPAVRQLASGISTGRAPDVELWRQIAEGLEWMLAASAGLVAQQRYLPALGNALEDIVAQVSKTLPNILEAMRIKDSVAVADILEYELADQLEQIKIALDLCFFNSQARGETTA